MIFDGWRLNNQIDRTCREQIEREVSSIRTVDLDRSYWLGPDSDRREYVARMGLFRIDMFNEHIPMLTWRLRRGGEIWTQWEVTAEHGTPLHTHYTRTLSEYRHYQSIIYLCPMSNLSQRHVGNLTREHWIMHKLGSETLI